MKLNSKGYMLVEIVLASVLAMGIAFFLLNLTYHFKNKNEDIQQSIYYTNDKIAITKNIMNDFDTLIVTKVSQMDEKNYIFDVKLKKDNTVTEQRKLQIEQGINGTIIRYGKWESDHFDQNHVSYYEKILEKSLIIGTPEFGSENEDPSKSYFSYIKIPMRSLYSDKSYDIKLFVSTTASLNTIQYLNEVSPGSYVAYSGSNGCVGKSCQGQNANYVSDSNMGQCEQSKFTVNGWRVAYVEEETAYLISAGAPECACVGTTGGKRYSAGSASCNDYGTKEQLEQYLNEIALDYCNNTYAFLTTCNEESAWSITDSDFNKITNTYLTDPTAGNNNDLLDNGSHYWFTNKMNQNSYYWNSTSKGPSLSLSSEFSKAYGVRPVIRLNPNVYITKGSGTYQDPYQISIKTP